MMYHTGGLIKRKLDIFALRNFLGILKDFRTGIKVNGRLWNERIGDRLKWKEF